MNCNQNIRKFQIDELESEGREPEVCERGRFREEQGAAGVRSWVANVLGCVSFFSCMSGLILQVLRHYSPSHAGTFCCLSLKLMVKCFCVEAVGGIRRLFLSHLVFSIDIQPKAA